MDHPYITYENNYIESIWWALRQIWDKGLIYEGHKVVPYCPRCGTALSSHEVAQGYKDVTEPSVYLRFQVEGQPDTYFTAWTTTPWTLPSNLALCVHPDANYILAELEDTVCGERKKRRYYVAEALAEEVLGSDFKVVAKCKGKELEGMTYEPLFDYALDIVKKSGKKAYYVTVDTYVTMSDGTGIVHIAPAFGDDDYQIGKKYQLPFVQFIKEDGTMPELTTEVAGLSFKEADPKIIDRWQSKVLLSANKTIPITILSVGGAILP